MDRAHRRRALAAMTEAVGDAGYAATTVADVLERAAMSRRTFYRCFRDREDCFLAAYDDAWSELLAVLPARRPADARAGALERRLAPVLAYLAASPARARLLVMEPTAAGATALARHEERLPELARRLGVGRGRPRERALTAEASVGVISRVVQARVVAGTLDELPALAADLAALIARVDGASGRVQRGHSAMR